LFATFPRALTAPWGERGGAGETMKGERLLKRTFFVPLVALGAILLLGTTGAFGASKSGGGEAFESPTGAWFVELSTTPEAFSAKAKGEGLQFTERHRFNKLWKGISVNANGETAQALKQLDGVVAVHPVGVVTAGPTQRVSEPELIHALAMTGADVAQNELGLDGTGIKVGVMDTGIDYHNPALGSCFGAGCRVATGYDFVGDRYDASGTGGALNPHPDNDPDDCNGHGTHVAGIVGAKGTVNDTEITGVAPGVTFGAYKVFGCAGSTSEDIMIAAMERAQADGMHVVNMSIGDAFAWDTEPFAQAMNAAVAEGTVVVISAGNSGTNGLFSLSSAGNAQDVIGVASIDNSHVELKTFTAAPDNRSFGYIQASGSPGAPTSGTSPLARTGTPTTGNDGCNVAGASPFAAGSLAGKIALIRRGTCTFWEKSLNAQNAGAIGVVLYNNAAGLFSATVAPQVPGGAPVTIPVVSISNIDGAELSSRLPAAFTSTIDLTWTDQTGIFPNPTAGMASSFTSWGMTPSLNLKPDIAAPGGLIKSTWPMEAGGFTTISGTSMAAPHVSGAAALFLEAYPGTAPLTLRQILQNSADPAPGTPSGLESVHRQGAGMLDIDDAILADASVTPSKVTLGEGTSDSFQLTITNNSSSSRDYTVAHQNSRVVLGTYPPHGTANLSATVGISPNAFTLGPGASQVVNVSVAALGIQGLLYGGWIRFSDGTKSYRVPYGGFDGDYQSIRALAPGACEFPGIFKAGGETTCGTGASAPKLTGFTRQAAGATYNVGNRPDRPVLLYHMAHQANRVEIRAVNAGGQEFVVAFQNLFERNPTNDLTATGFFVYTWDGKAVFTNEKTGKSNRRSLPSGTYKLRMLVTKALAEPNNPAHIETWDSPTMNIISG
jgi:minor extracellular serine protease Vpr